MSTSTQVKTYTKLNTFLAEYPKLDLDSRDYKYLSAAEQISRKSKRDMNKVGCVIVQRNEIIGCGCNTIKTHPFQAKWNKLSSCLHAEMVALLEAMRNTDFNPARATVYVSRYGRCGLLGCSFPCHSCWAALDYTGIRRVVCYDQYSHPTKIKITG